MDQQIDQSTVPNEFLCPIFQQIMKDPVLTVDGFCFQRRAIQEWFSKGKSTNPLTNQKLASTSLVSNRVLRQVIDTHNTRIRGIEAQANESAKKIIKQSNQTIRQIFPQLIEQNGMVSLDKLITISIQTNKLRSTLKNSAVKFNQFKKITQKQPLVVNNCRQCKSMIETIKQYRNYIQKQTAQALKIESSLPQREIKKQRLNYIIINSQCVKGIDFRRIKPNDLTKHVIQAILLNRLPVQEVISRIRTQRKINPKDFVRIWITDITTQNLYKHIVEQVQSITGTYVCKVKCVGKRIQNLKKKINDLEMTEQQFWIVEHGPGQQYVFRNNESKCDYCYKIKKVQSQCECKKVFYCSKQCQNKDKNYHERVCKLIPGNGSQNYLGL